MTKKRRASKRKPYPKEGKKDMGMDAEMSKQMEKVRRKMSTIK